MATFRALRPRARASLPVVLLSSVSGVAADLLFHAAASAHLDVDYLSPRSDDAVPSLVDSLPTLGGNDASRLKSLLCTRDLSGAGWAQGSVASIAARDAPVRLCAAAGSA